VRGPNSWLEVLRAPAYVINLDSRPERLRACVDEIQRAGFTDVRRYTAVDGHDPAALAQAWSACGNPPLDQSDRGFQTYLGKQGCFLSHLFLWRQVADDGQSHVCIFEDDIFFHRHWPTLAPFYFEFTPKDWDIVYMGNGIHVKRHGLVQRVPAVCHHAYIVTAAGARRLVDALLETPRGVYSKDMMMYHQQWRDVEDGVPAPYSWYAWNGASFPDARARVHKDWYHYNTGIVFQNRDYPSDLQARGYHKESRN
jgi:GR25 family glycosyltransferase involved in LPS biosynthesis